MKNQTKLSRILVILVCSLFSFCFVGGVFAQSGTVMTAQPSSTQPQVGSTLTVTIKISNVQNLAGIDTTLTWNPAVLGLQNSALDLGGSNGVLHGTVNTNIDTQKSGDILVIETKVSGSYELVASEVATAGSNAGYTGSGTIVTLTFNVNSAGSANLNLQTDLTDFPAAGQNSQNINHQDTADTVTAVTSGSSSPTASASPTTSTSPNTSPVTPEFPTIAIIAALIALATATAVLTIKKRRNIK
jgi:hypothetical protein